MTKRYRVAEIIDLINNIRRFEHNENDFYMGWRSALDTVISDLKELEPIEEEKECAYCVKFPDKPCPCDCHKETAKEECNIFFSFEGHRTCNTFHKAGDKCVLDCEETATKENSLRARCSAHWSDYNDDCPICQKILKDLPKVTATEEAYKAVTELGGLPLGLDQQDLPHEHKWELGGTEEKYKGRTGYYVCRCGKYKEVNLTKEK